jgi:hypothetical protein
MHESLMMEEALIPPLLAACFLSLSRFLVFRNAAWHRAGGFRFLLWTIFSCFSLQPSMGLAAFFPFCDMHAACCVSETLISGLLYDAVLPC